MPPRAKKGRSAPSTVSELKNTLWKAADRLRGSLPASRYKDVILGLVFLKYVSDAYDEHRETVHAELSGQGYDEDRIAGLIDDPATYRQHGVFVVPPAARWSYLAANAKGGSAGHTGPARTVGRLIDEAMESVMEANPTLRGTLPRLYDGETLDQRRLCELLDLFDGARFSRRGEHRTRDLMGEVYEYFLGRFARAEGKRGGEFFTPPSVVKVLVEVLEPSSGRVYDPCCGSGGMFVQTEKFLHEHNGDPADIAVHGQESNEETWRMATMNLAVHGIDNSGLGARWDDTFARDRHPGVRMDYVLANPPFNIKHWSRDERDPRWRFGVPPAHNANFAWIQHILSKLGPTGSAGVVLANGSMTSRSGTEGDIRARIVEADLVSCMVALPTQLFRSTGIPVCLWFFSRDKTAGPGGAVDRSGEVLFIDARDLGHLVDRAERALSDDDIARIADTYRAWRGTRSATERKLVYEDEPGFCRSVGLAGIRAADHVLTPGRYVGTPEIEDDGEPVDERIRRLHTELLAAFDESARLEKVVRAQLERTDG
ncbi:class I SAM-dependent DNA methyltransferase [Saccharomonospora halophila]|uniref:class I SAM-dependent DNA methyltransferase n=1 Tax=Saccharomonospora halophila TaxID=129922 RepID=UPI00037437A7|nr:type I restriction-modification system subunit M [Saccharomonospora halophila]